MLSKLWMFIGVVNDIQCCQHYNFEQKLYARYQKHFRKFSCWIIQARKQILVTHFHFRDWISNLIRVLSNTVFSSPEDHNFHIFIDSSYHLTHWNWRQMAASFLTTFSNALYSNKMSWYRLRYHWSLFPMVQLTILQCWFRYRLRTNRRQGIIWNNDG